MVEINEDTPVEEELKEEQVTEDEEAAENESETSGGAEEESVDDGEADEVTEEKADDSKEEKGRHKKGDKKLEALTKKTEELEDRVKRQMAEFENFRKRTEKEKATMFEMGAKSVIEKLLPVVDNFERGLASASDEDKADPIYEGMNLIYKQLADELDKLGVKPIEALGKEFNPEFHNAVMQEESDEFEEGIICKELQKGYTYRDSVVRHSMVAVAK